MLFKTTAIVAAALVLTGHAMANPIGSEVANEPGNEVRDTSELQIATDPYYACNCPNNCSHKKGSSCKYYSGPSSDSKVIDGHCSYMGSYLWCTA